MADTISEAAERIWNVYRSRTPCTPVRDVIGATDVEAAYAVQETNTARWLKVGRKLSGRKIGLTSKAVQQQLGVDQPDFGMLFADMICPDGELLPATHFMQPRVEAEIALVLSGSLERERHSIEDIANATAYAVAAIEIVDSRIAKWDIRLADTVADNASSGGYVLASEPKKLADGCSSTTTKSASRRPPAAPVATTRSCTSTLRCRDGPKASRRPTHSPPSITTSSASTRPRPTSSGRSRT